MAGTRQAAVTTATSRKIRTFARVEGKDARPARIHEFYGVNVFGPQKMRERLPPEIYQRWLDIVERGARPERSVAEAIAHAVKEWALENGCTHFCHWFHPMTGQTAEKHDSFLAFDNNGQAIEKFSASMLIQSEPDASSFPSGGMRSTFEARGYTSWDPTSPMFLIETPNSKTLCIPSAFLGYHGQALDEKAPLLRSMEALNRAAASVLKKIGAGEQRVTATIGAEQEYFLVDRAYHGLRPDLAISGRSLVGAKAPRGQMLEDHYFGSIPDRVLAFMEEVESELYKLGVSAKTRHNEVAPAQFEIAPIFAEANIAADHNQLLMQVLRRVAARHDFAVLLHEKPFAGVNGSGKHLNWSMATHHGDNLLEPGSNPQENLRFVTFLAGVLLGVHRHAAVLRAAIASHGNDFRLGANEAPPAIISVFLGDYLTRLVNTIASGELEKLPTGQAMIELGVSRLPLIAQDNTDRNRTSPFAFTGNKFEFRAVGSSASISWPATCLNAAVADGLSVLGGWIDAEGGSAEGVMRAIRKALQEALPVCFDGNGYSQEWVDEAERRGLPHFRNTPSALKALHSEAARQLFARQGVLSPEELEARFEVRVDQYNKKVEIEAQILTSLVDTTLLPAAVEDLAEAARIKDACPSAAAVVSRYTALLLKVEAVAAARAALGEALDGLPEGSEVERSGYLCEKVVTAMADLRATVDALEGVVSDARWPLPKYGEMLFLY